MFVDVDCKMNSTLMDEQPLIAKMPFRKTAFITTAANVSAPASVSGTEWGIYVSVN